MENLKLILFIVILATGTFFLIKNLFFKKKEISIEIKNCIGCPFKDKRDGMLHYSCRLQNIIYGKNHTFQDMDIMKTYCPKKGEFKIEVK